MMNEELEKLLKSWIDGELTPEQAAEVALYLKSNPGAQATVADYRRVAALIRKLAEDAPLPIPRPESIVRRARRRDQEERQLIQWLQRVTAAAALLLVTTLGVLLSSAAAGDAGALAPQRVVDPFVDRDEAMMLALNDPGLGEYYR